MKQENIIKTILKQLWTFVLNGVHVLRLAVRGNYHQESEEIIRIRKEVLEDCSNRHTDKENLINDRKKIASDMHKALRLTTIFVRSRK